MKYMIWKRITLCMAKNHGTVIKEGICIVHVVGRRGWNTHLWSWIYRLLTDEEYEKFDTATRERWKKLQKKQYAGRPEEEYQYTHISQKWCQQYNNSFDVLGVEARLLPLSSYWSFLKSLFSYSTRLFHVYKNTTIMQLCNHKNMTNRQFNDQFKSVAKMSKFLWGWSGPRLIDFVLSPFWRGLK